MNNRQRNRHQREHTSKLDVFPEEFDDIYFHEQTVEQDKNIAILRSMVYKKIKTAIIDRVSKYTLNEFSLEDKFNVDFDVESFSPFQWAVIREELLDRGFDAKFNFTEGKISSMTVPVERTISLTETLKDVNKKYREKNCCQVDTSSSDSEEEY